MAINEENLVILALEDVENLRHFVKAAVYGIETAIAAIHQPDFLKIAENAIVVPGKVLALDAYEKRTTLFGPIKDFVIREKMWDFGFLYGTVTVRLWTIMETVVDELVISALAFRNVQSKDVQELVGPLIPFLKMSSEEQAEHLAGELKIKLKAKLKVGAGRFECLLNAVNLGGSIESDVNKALLELSEVRHILVHRSGTADGKLLKDRCPWLPFEIGEEVRVNEAAFQSYTEACVWYLFELWCRVSPSDNPNMKAFRDKQAKDLASLKSRKRYVPRR